MQALTAAPFPALPLCLANQICRWAYPALVVYPKSVVEAPLSPERLLSVELRRLGFPRRVAIEAALFSGQPPLDFNLSELLAAIHWVQQQDGF